MKIILHFKGGLGNQLIQYAFVNKFFNDEDNLIIYDTSHYLYFKKRAFFLDILPNKKVSFIQKCINAIKLHFKTFYSRITKTIPLPFTNYILSNFIDDYSDINKILKKKKNTIYVNGYFQHIPIFPLKDGNSLIDILNSLSPKIENNSNFELLNRNTNGVMLHLRRGDYVTNKEVQKMMGECSFRYYYEGIKILTKYIDNYSLFVFSDDIEYAKEFFKDMKPLPFFIKGNINNPVEDFLLMRKFEYAIISNSTLSYMAAILSESIHNKVIVPNPWFNNNSQFLLGLKPNWIHVNKSK